MYCDDIFSYELERQKEKLWEILSENRSQHFNALYNRQVKFTPANLSEVLHEQLRKRIMNLEI